MVGEPECIGVYLLCNKNDDIKKSPSCIASNLTTSISAVLIATHTAHAFFVNLIFA
jgi:hypothetical protein